MVGPGPRADEEPAREVERMKLFTDAVVAIAMTLLILPLLESVSESRDLATAEFLHEHQSQIISFLISFAVIAGFWVSHERLFARIGTWTAPLMVLNIAWMLTIVVLPVTTAMTGSMETDRPQIAVYVGAMLASSVAMLGMNVVAERDPSVSTDDRRRGHGGLAASASLVILFTAALVLALVFPGLSYFWLFLLFLTGPLQRVVEHLLTRR